MLTFRPRRGRVSNRQRSALERLWGRYGVEVEPRRLDPVARFGRDAPLVLEIGFGMGEATAALAAAQPELDVLAVDVHTPGIGALLHRVEELGLSNVRIVAGDALEVLRDMLGPASLAEVRVFFPDPWPKERHRKRRLVGPAFAALAASRLRPGGRLHLATDWAPYAAQMLAIVAAEPLLEAPAESVPRPDWRPVTRFESHGLRQGRSVTDISAVRRG